MNACFHPLQLGLQDKQRVTPQKRAAQDDLGKEWTLN